MAAFFQTGSNGPSREERFGLSSGYSRSIEQEAFPGVTLVNPESYGMARQFFKDGSPFPNVVVLQKAARKPQLRDAITKRIMPIVMTGRVVPQSIRVVGDITRDLVAAELGRHVMGPGVSYSSYNLEYSGVRQGVMARLSYEMANENPEGFREDVVKKSVMLMQAMYAARFEACIQLLVNCGTYAEFKMCLDTRDRGNERDLFHPIAGTNACCGAAQKGNLADILATIKTDHSAFIGETVDIMLVPRQISSTMRLTLSTAEIDIPSARIAANLMKVGSDGTYQSKGGGVPGDLSELGEAAVDKNKDAILGFLADDLGLEVAELPQAGRGAYKDKAAHAGANLQRHITKGRFGPLNVDEAYLRGLVNMVKSGRGRPEPPFVDMPAYGRAGWQRITIHECLEANSFTLGLDGQGIGDIDNDVRRDDLSPHAYHARFGYFVHPTSPDMIEPHHALTALLGYSFNGAVDTVVGGITSVGALMQSGSMLGYTFWLQQMLEGQPSVGEGFHRYGDLALDTLNVVGNPLVALNVLVKQLVNFSATGDLPTIFSDNCTRMRPSTNVGRGRSNRAPGPDAAVRTAQMTVSLAGNSGTAEDNLRVRFSNSILAYIAVYGFSGVRYLPDVLISLYAAGVSMTPLLAGIVQVYRITCNMIEALSQCTNGAFNVVSSRQTLQATGNIDFGGDGQPPTPREDLQFIRTKITNKHAIHESPVYPESYDARGEHSTTRAYNAAEPFSGNGHTLGRGSAASKSGHSSTPLETIGMQLREDSRRADENLEPVTGDSLLAEKAEAILENLDTLPASAILIDTMTALYTGDTTPAAKASLDAALAAHPFDLNSALDRINAFLSKSLDLAAVNSTKVVGDLFKVGGPRFLLSVASNVKTQSKDKTALEDEMACIVRVLQWIKDAYSETENDGPLRQILLDAQKICGRNSSGSNSGENLVNDVKLALETVQKWYETITSVPRTDTTGTGTDVKCLGTHIPGLDFIIPYRMLAISPTFIRMNMASLLSTSFTSGSEAERAAINASIRELFRFNQLVSHSDDSAIRYTTFIAGFASSNAEAKINPDIVTYSLKDDAKAAFLTGKSIRDALAKSGIKKNINYAHTVSQALGSILGVSQQSVSVTKDQAFAMCCIVSLAAEDIDTGKSVGETDITPLIRSLNLSLAMRQVNQNADTGARSLTTVAGVLEPWKVEFRSSTSDARPRLDGALVNETLRAALVIIGCTTLESASACYSMLCSCFIRALDPEVDVLSLTLEGMKSTFRVLGLAPPFQADVASFVTMAASSCLMFYSPPTEPVGILMCSDIRIEQRTDMVHGGTLDMNGDVLPALLHPDRALLITDVFIQGLTAGGDVNLCSEFNHFFSALDRQRRLINCNPDLVKSAIERNSIKNAFPYIRLLGEEGNNHISISAGPDTELLRNVSHCHHHLLHPAYQAMRADGNRHIVDPPYLPGVTPMQDNVIQFAPQRGTFAERGRTIIPIIPRGPYRYPAIDLNAGGTSLVTINESYTVFGDRDGPTCLRDIFHASAAAVRVGDGRHALPIRSRVQRT